MSLLLQSTCAFCIYVELHASKKIISLSINEFLYQYRAQSRDDAVESIRIFHAISIEDGIFIKSDVLRDTSR